MKSQAFPSNQNSHPGSDTLVVSLETLDRTALPPAGGKAANSGELIHAGFAVPAGFCITTAAYERVAGRDGTHTWIGAFPLNCSLKGSESLTVMKLWRTRDE
jgi:phosphoenolpyruvate synthase/pyruvate phosphate dikinase